MAILLVKSEDKSRNLYSFYNHRICKRYNEIEEKYQASFRYCQRNIHGKQIPNYESNYQVSRRKVYDKKIKDTPQLDSHTEYGDLSCYKLRRILEGLFETDFKKVTKIYFKGGNFEQEFFRSFINNDVNIIDLGNFDVTELYK